MKLLKKIDGSMQPVRWVASVIMLFWYGVGAAFMVAVGLPWFSIPFLIMAVFALWGVIHNARNRYWYHDNE